MRLFKDSTYWVENYDVPNSLEILTTSSPFYVTNKTANGITFQVSSPIFVILAFWLIVGLNAFGWGIYGLTQLIGKI